MNDKGVVMVAEPLTMSVADEREDRIAAADKGGSGSCDPYRLKCAWDEIDALRSRLAGAIEEHADCALYERGAAVRIGHLEAALDEVHHALFKRCGEVPPATMGERRTLDRGRVALAQTQKQQVEVSGHAGSPHGKTAPDLPVDAMRAALRVDEGAVLERAAALADAHAEVKLWDLQRHANAMASHLQSLADNGYEFHSPANCDLVDALLAAHAARVSEKP